MQKKLLDPQIYERLNLKGNETAGIPLEFNPSAVDVRRVVQLARDFSARPLESQKVIDLACGEGVYAIEFALQGATVTAVDGRDARLNDGVKIKNDLKLDSLDFIVGDVRTINEFVDTTFDTVLFLGIQYHLDVPDVFNVLSGLYELCDGILIIDTHVSLDPDSCVVHDGHRYDGHFFREHSERDSYEMKASRVLASLDNNQSFWFTIESLVRLLKVTGFTSVVECHVPEAHSRKKDRVTLVARKGTTVNIATYPWINGCSEQRISELVPEDSHTALHGAKGLKAVIKNAVNGILKPTGYLLRRV